MLLNRITTPEVKIMEQIENVTTLVPPRPGADALSLI
jgi:hypothetical protein